MSKDFSVRDRLQREKERMSELKYMSERKREKRKRERARVYVLRKSHREKEREQTFVSERWSTCQREKQK